MSHKVSPSDVRRAQRKALLREGKEIPAEFQTVPVVREFYAGPSRSNDKRWVIVAKVNNDGGAAVRELRSFIGCWPYETAWMEATGGATVLAHEGEAIAQALVEKGWAWVRM